MKILAATPQKGYNTCVYIVELDEQEIKALTTFEPYTKIPVTDSNGVSQEREKHALLAGDVIAPEVAASTVSGIRCLIDDRAEIAKASNVIRGALTKLQNTLKNAQ